MRVGVRARARREGGGVQESRSDVVEGRNGVKGESEGEGGGKGGGRLGVRPRLRCGRGRGQGQGQGRSCVMRRGGAERGGRKGVGEGRGTDDSKRAGAREKSSGGGANVGRPRRWSRATQRECTNCGNGERCDCCGVAKNVVDHLVCHRDEHRRPSLQQHQRTLSLA